MIEFTYNGTKYRVTEVQHIEKFLTNIRHELVKNNKEPSIYFASKVLKNGSTSENQGGMFYRSSLNSDIFVQI